jgi:tRNA nucleotidyltransferase/poly(A) polymerase
MKDIDITGKEVMTLLNLEPSKKVSEIITDVKIEILKKNLKNKKNEIKKFILGRYKNE